MSVRARTVPGLCVLGALLACGGAPEDLTPQDLCDDVGFSIANVVERCTGDYELANDRFDQYEKLYDCRVKSVTHPEMREYYVCPVALRDLTCEQVAQFGDDLDLWFQAVPICVEVVQHADGTPIDPPDAASDAGADAGPLDAESDAPDAELDSAPPDSGGGTDA